MATRLSKSATRCFTETGAPAPAVAPLPPPPPPPRPGEEAGEPTDLFARASSNRATKYAASGDQKEGKTRDCRVIKIPSFRTSVTFSPTSFRVVLTQSIGEMLDLVSLRGAERGKQDVREARGLVAAHAVLHGVRPRRRSVHCLGQRGDGVGRVRGRRAHGFFLRVAHVLHGCQDRLEKTVIK